MKPATTISPREFERIEQWLDGEMSSTELQAFEQLLQTDEDLQGKVNEVELLRIGIRQSALKDKLKEYHTGIEQPKSKVLMIRKTWLIAASILVVIVAGAWIIFGQSSNEKIYSKFYIPDPGLMTPMAASQDYQFDRAMVDYRNGDYRAAIDAWSVLTKERPSDTLTYFLGVAHLAAADNTAALQLLGECARKTSHPFYKDACWYYGLLLIKMGDTEKAKSFIIKAGRPEAVPLLKTLDKN